MRENTFFIPHFIPRCNASDDLRADIDASEEKGKKKIKYTKEQLIAVRDSVEEDPALNARVQAILAGKGLSEVVPEDDEKPSVVTAFEATD